MNAATEGVRNGNGRGPDLEEAVLHRYRKAALKAEAGLCVPVTYDRRLLEVIPDEILEKDYGCGDPSRHVREGETVLYQDYVGKKLGYHNVEFRRGKIQNLRLNLDLIERYLARHPIRSLSDLHELQQFEEKISREQPLIEDESVDAIVSNCVLNLVRPEDKRQLFAEMYRVLKKGGRVAISDIVSDEPVPEHLSKDPELWSGCVSGAFQEEEFLPAFEEAKFYGIHVEEMRSEPYRTIEGIEFRSITITAYKGKEGPCIERNQAVIYRGPWKLAVDDDNHVLPRGVRIAVCDKTFQIYAKPPYKDQFILIPPREEIPLEKAGVFDCSRDHKRHPRETKGMDYRVTETSPNVCGPGSACCL
ncbi:MAG: methyltransferase domain-containing protein [Deltaproteobacteria bacterium]|nr:methyltransferase domain-containing protein [Deltaproteobacteria bacterium]